MQSAPWQPGLVDWAFETLGPYLAGGDQERFEASKDDWQSQQIGALSRCAAEDRLAALFELRRIEWTEAHRPAAEALRDELLEALPQEELEELARRTLESGHLRLAEQGNYSLRDAERLLDWERSFAWLVRGALLRGAGRGGAGRKLARRLRSLCRKLHAQRDEARLQRRLEHIFSERLVLWFSRLTFTALIGLLVLLLADVWLPQSGFWPTFMFWADTGICFLFLWEFLVRLAITPGRGRWVLRHFLTDFVPAIPFALFLTPGPGEGHAAAEGAEFLIRSVRLVRLPVYIRSLRFLRPLVAFFRVLIFWVRGMDRLIQKLEPILNRDIVFFENRVTELQKESEVHRVTTGPRSAFLRLSIPMRDKAAPALLGKLEFAVQHYRAVGLTASGCFEGLAQAPRVAAGQLRAEDAIDSLRALRSEQVEESIPRDVVSSLGRLLRLMDLPFLRSLPLFGRMVHGGKGTGPTDRIAHAGQVVGSWFHSILGLLHGYADLAGVVTAPQILDRVATAIVKSTQRPAVRLLLFGSLFLLLKLIFEVLLPFDVSGLSRVLERFIVGPILILGVICLVLLLSGRWMKKVAGEASDRLLRSNEARFANLMELLHRENEEQDRAVLIERVTGWEGDEAASFERELIAAMDELRGRGNHGHGSVSKRARSLALLLLDVQDGGFLHSTNTKTTQQFLSHPDLWMLRHEVLRVSKREDRRIDKLDLDSGSLLSGPHFWFELLTHAVAVKVARVCAMYNLHAISLEDQGGATEDAVSRHQQLVHGGAALRVEPRRGRGFSSSYFHVLHFLTVNPIWDAEIERDFGSELLASVKADRRLLVRELFGTRALDRLPLELRRFNPFDFYIGKLGGGRVLLLPFRFVFAWLKLLLLFAKVALKSLREVLDPKRASGAEIDNAAPFSVARRKLRRMKKPLLLEAMQLLARVDPSYLGLCADGSREEGGSLWASDLDSLDPTRNELLGFEELREEMSARLLYFPDFLASLPDSPAEGSVEWQRLFAAFATDEAKLASLAAAEARADAWLHQCGNEEEVPPGALPPAPRRATRGTLRRGFKRLLSSLGTISPRERRYLRRALRRDRGDFRTICAAFAELDRPTSLGVRHGCQTPFSVTTPQPANGEASSGAPETGVRHRCLTPMRLGQERAAWLRGGAGRFAGCVETARAVLSLILLDLLHHERLVFVLGDYETDASDGESAA